MRNFKLKNYSSGMTYVELIVVLSIFAIMTSVVMYNYGAFQANVDLKNLATDIALKIVQAQKTALSGVVTSHIATVSPWKPAYGVYFSTVVNANADSKDFIDFVDLNNNSVYDDASCSPSNTSGECLDKVSITKNDNISSLNVFYKDSTSAVLSDLTLTFTRPNAGPAIVSTTSLASNIDYVQITLHSPNSSDVLIKVYPSGRIQVN